MDKPCETEPLSFRVGDALFRPRSVDGWLKSFGPISIRGTPVRGDTCRFFPWFDSFNGGVFSRIRLADIRTQDGRVTLQTIACTDPDYPFRERRDSSGDLAFPECSWDAEPAEAQLRIVFEPAVERLDGLDFTGFRYWFEYESQELPIHRLLDRQTWEVGGCLDDVTVVCRNWLTPPRVRVRREDRYSSTCVGQFADLMPGNLWARGSLLPAFDLQYGNSGVLCATFDRLTNIRTIIQSTPGEDAIRWVDMHQFPSSTTVSTNPKTILFSPQRLTDTDAVNLWTRLHDREQAKAKRQMGLRHDPAPAIVFSKNVWRDFRFDTTYEDVVATAAEFGGEYVFIDPVWEHQEAFREELEQAIPAENRKGTVLEKFWHQNMCATLDWQVARIHGGEEGLRALCERASAVGVKILTWFAAHYSPNTFLQTANRDPELSHLAAGTMGVFAARESGRHPDTGYPASCWPMNLNTPVMERVRDQILEVCRRTGIAGLYWDSFSNLGWWQVDYSDGSMRPQVDRMLELYRDFSNAGLYLMPEGFCSFTSRSSCGLHGGDIYGADLLAYSYDMNTPLPSATADHGGENDILRGKRPVSDLFRCVAHKRIPVLHFHQVPPNERDPAAAAQIKRVLETYKRVRRHMIRRVVLPDDAGVLWHDQTGRPAVLFSFVERASTQPLADPINDAPCTHTERYRAYLIV
jgi:hypothetical protein